MMGNDQCGYPQTPFPMNSGDYVNADQQRLKGLKDYRASLAAKMNKINADLAKAQKVIKAYFGPPWCDAMFAHMDNEFDCCPSRIRPTSAQVGGNDARMPAGQNNPDPYVDIDDYTQPPPSDDYTEPPASDDEYTEPPAGQHCLQTGFGSSRDWNKYACRDGGQIDPEVCSNGAISKSPGNYQKCVGILKIYRDLAAQKRELAGQIEDLDMQINSRNGGGDGSGKKSFMSGIGNFLGGVISVAVPFIISQYMSYSAQKQMANAPMPGPRHVLAQPGGGRMMYGPGGGRSGSLGFGGQMSPPPPYYGPNYGYGFGNGGQYGMTLPGFQMGGFGCSPGMMGGGLNLLSMLMGGGGMGMGGGMGGLMGALLGGNMRMNMGINASLGGSFGMMGGGAPYAAMNMGYGNSVPYIPPYAMGGFSPLYQPGGIYGGTPSYMPNYSGSAVPNFYTGQPSSNYYAPMSGCNACMMPLPGSSNYSGANSFYYAQQMANNQRIAENQAAYLRRQSELDYQLYQLRLMNNQQYMPTGTNYQMGNFNGLGSSLYGF
jgi:hypothetical protein